MIINNTTFKYYYYHLATIKKNTLKSKETKQECVWFVNIQRDFPAKKINKIIIMKIKQIQPSSLS